MCKNVEIKPFFVNDPTPKNAGYRAWKKRLFSPWVGFGHAYLARWYYFGKMTAWLQALSNEV